MEAAGAGAAVLGTGRTVSVVFYFPGAGSAGGHNGLSSIDSNLGSGVYPRVRIGVGEKPSGGKPANWDQADYVLSAFREDEWADLQPALETAPGAP